MNPSSIVVPVVRARTPLQRFVGLLGRWRPAPGHGLLFERCRAVHTFGMRRPIDVVFVDRDGRVLELRRGLGGGRIAACRAAAMVIELQVGDAWRLGLWPGCRITPIDVWGSR
jgi:hypothetical protein